MAKNKELTLEEKLREALIPKEELPYEIPENWEWVKWGNIAEITSSKRVLQKDWKKSGVPFYRAREIVSLAKTGFVQNELFISEKHYLEISEISKVPKAGDLMVTGIGTIGITYLVTEGDYFYYKDASVLCVSKLGNIDSKFLKYLMSSSIMKSQIRQNSSGSTVDSLTINKYKEYILPLPPLEEQKRIVEKLDSMFEKINRAKELIQEVKENIGNRKESILNKAFRGELTAEWRKNNQTEDAIELLKSINEEKLKNWEEACIEAEKSGKKKPSKPKIEDIQNIIISKEEEPYEIPKNWKWVKLGEVIDIKMGQSPNGETVNNTEGIGLIGGPNDMGNLYPKISRYTTSFTKLSSKDDIILSVRATLGRPIFSDGEYCLGRGVCGISSEIINKIFLRHYFFNITDYLYTIATGTTFVQISKENIINLNFPLPPLKEQEEIVRILDEILEKESKIKELIELEEAIELLEKSILDKAFRGKLGTQNKEDEPAIELLKKIL